MSFTLHGAALGAVAALTALPSAASTFDITVNFSGGLSESQQSVFAAAETYWESVILDYAYDDPRVNGLTIEARGVPIDGTGSVLGQAGWTSAYFGGSYGSADWAYAVNGIMQFDTADFDALEHSGMLFDVVVHEMAHVLGFGTLWRHTGHYDLNGHYTGAAALAAYQAECDPNATYVPVELGGGAGTAHAHWDEGWACGSQALMTGWLGGHSLLTATTIAAFSDLGYIVAGQTMPAVPTPGGLPLLLGGALGLGVLRRRSSVA